MRAAALSVSRDVLQYGSGGTHSARFERDVRVENTVRRLAALRDAGAGLVFGRIDREDGERLYIGVTAISDEHNEPLVVDWRAPAAEPFYRATPGHPMGVRRRRHFMMNGRKLVGIEDDLLDAAAGAAIGNNGAGESDLVLVGEAALLASLSRSRTGRMHDIVATIQKEQDEAIRAPLRGVLVVQGGPGTGKTAVALHRAAYLLYTHRFPLERSGVLLVGPSRVFLRYVEQVLPSLGEETVAFGTPSTLVASVEASGRDRPGAERIKGDARMATLIARAVRQRQRPLAKLVHVRAGAHLLTLTPEATTDIVRRVKRRRGTHNERRAAFEREVTRVLVAQWWEREGRPEDETVREDLEYQLHGQRDLAIALERMWPVLTPATLLNDLFGIRALLKLSAHNVLERWEWELLERPRQRRLSDVRWTDDDVALLDEAARHLGPIPRRRQDSPRNGPDDDEAMIDRTMMDIGPVDPFMRADLRAHLAEWARDPDDGRGRRADNGGGEHSTRTYGHVLVDEAQELSAMQARMIGRRAPGGSMTIVGDLGQGSGEHAAAGWEGLVSHLAPRHDAHIVELSVNYRSPVEVMDLAARVLAAAAPGLEPPRSVRASNEAPVYTVASAGQLVEAVAMAARNEVASVGDGRVAVIAADGLVDAVRDAMGLPDAGTRALEQPLAVYSVNSAKGLEFDSVVVVEPAAIVADGVNGMRGLYVALTRTTRRLNIVHEAPLPKPLLPEPLMPAPLTPATGSPSSVGG